MELLPCPFCGGEALPTAHLTYNWFAPVCRRCNARGPSVKIERDSDPQEMRNLMNQADENWNRRASPASAPEDVIDAVTIALRKAFQLGQTYWQQADSDYISQNKKSDDTYAKFLVLSEEISALLATAPTPPVSEDRWQPIETAPKETTQMFVVVAFGAKVGATPYNSDPWCVWHQRGEFVRWPHKFSPTHWMPLPKAPTMQEDKKP